MEALKFCKDCKYFDASRGPKFSECISPSGELDLTTGEVYPIYADIARKSEHRCGRPAAWFEPKVATPETAATKIERMHWLQKLWKRKP